MSVVTADIISGLNVPDADVNVPDSQNLLVICHMWTANVSGPSFPRRFPEQSHYTIVIAIFILTLAKGQQLVNMVKSTLYNLCNL